MAYIPLFLSMHDNIIENPLDMSTKYHNNKNTSSVRDMNPLGLPLKPAFLEYPKEIYPSGIPPGKPLLQATPNVEQSLEPTPVIDKADSVANPSTRPPSERSSRLVNEVSQTKKERLKYFKLYPHPVTCETSFCNYYVTYMGEAMGL